MNERELALLEKLMKNQGDMIAAIGTARSAEEISVLETVAETQYLIAQALTPAMQIVGMVADDEPPTLQ